MKNKNNNQMPILIALITILFLWYGVVSFAFSSDTQFTITKKVCADDYICKFSNWEEDKFGYVFDHCIKETTCSQVEVDVIIILYGYQDVFPEGEIPLYRNISKQDLNLEWLYENAECAGGCEYECSQEYDIHKDIDKLNECVHERNCPKTPYPVCSKYKLGNFTIEVLK